MAPSFTPFGSTRLLTGCGHRFAAIGSVFGGRFFPSRERVAFGGGWFDDQRWLPSLVPGAFFRRVDVTVFLKWRFQFCQALQVSVLRAGRFVRYLVTRGGIGLFFRGTSGMGRNSALRKQDFARRYGFSDGFKKRKFVCSSRRESVSFPRTRIAGSFPYGNFRTHQNRSCTNSKSHDHAIADWRILSAWAVCHAPDRDRDSLEH